MEVTNTPGPWTYEEEAYSMERVFGPKGLVAQVVGDSAETIANAHLIAAAPELLAALEEFMEIMDVGYGFPDREKLVSLFSIKAKMAIAKAKGAGPR